MDIATIIISAVSALAAVISAIEAIVANRKVTALENYIRSSNVAKINNKGGNQGTITGINNGR